MTRTTSLLAALAVAFSTSSALAQSSTGDSPADPNTNQNQQPGPSVGNPADPAAGSDPAARVPTSPPGTTDGSGSATEGLGSGESGLDSPAGNPSDPNTNENQQMGPSNTNPADPEAGSNPAARVPTDRY
ncbi:hypothetical protein [Hyphomicrobium sp.]|uniref:hypothetical protein n=1 Tax=Hyphomicrobium sp. TaxID=82 RepID=UPI0025C67A6F|nr:hypothetical protein [Hyphomicrobium sp.]MCC7252835.1 hypothetical protein [Hyphomicrobium sp.]